MVVQKRSSRQRSCREHGYNTVKRKVSSIVLLKIAPCEHQVGVGTGVSVGVGAVVDVGAVVGVKDGVGVCVTVGVSVRVGVVVTVAVGTVDGLGVRVDVGTLVGVTVIFFFGVAVISSVGVTTMIVVGVMSAVDVFAAPVPRPYMKNNTERITTVTVPKAPRIITATFV